MRTKTLLASLATTLLVLSSIADAQTPLRQSTSRVVRICGAVAVGDGFTPVTTLDVSTADEAEALRDNTATLDISGATFAAVTGADGCYSLTLDATATNTVGELVVVIQDDSLILPLKRTFQVVEESVYDNVYAAAAVGPLTAAQVNVEADTALTDYDPPTNAEMEARTLVAANYFDFTTDTADANLTEILSTAVAESTGGRIAGNFNTFYDNGDAATTSTLDDVGAGAGGSFWSTGEQQEIRGRLGITGTTAAGGNTPTLALEATVAGLNDLSAAEVNIEVDTALTDYDAVVPGDLPTNFADLDIEATTGHVDVGFWNGSEITTPLQTATDFVNEWETQSQADPTGFHVNVLEVGGTAQTANDNGADLNTALVDIADIPTVAEFNARTLVSGSYFDFTTDTTNANLAEILGTAVAESSSGRIAGNFNTFYDNADAATTSTLDDVGAGAGGSFWSSGEQQEIRGRLGITGTTAAGGNTPTLATQVSVDDVPTVSEFNARTQPTADYFDPAADAVANVTLVDTTTTNTDMRGTDNAATASSLSTHDGKLDTVDANIDVLRRAVGQQDTTIATLASQVSFTLTGGSSDDDAYNGCGITITDQGSILQFAFAGVQDYVGSTRTVTLDADPGIFTMATGDLVTISCQAVSTEFMNKSEVLGTGASGDPWTGN